MSEINRTSPLPRAARRAIAGALVAVMLTFMALAVIACGQVTTPSSLWPDLAEFDRLLLAHRRPMSRFERMLESTEGNIDNGGTMRPAFTTSSTGWNAAVANLTDAAKAALFAEREGERLALLDWARTGGSREAYESDDHTLQTSEGARALTAAYRIDQPPADGVQTPPHIRIRTLLADRCVTCHSDEGRHEIARFIPLDKYAEIEPRLVPEPADGRSRWLVAAITALIVWGTFSTGSFYAFSSQPHIVRNFFMAATAALLGAITACWLGGQLGGWYGAAIVGLGLLGVALFVLETATALGELARID